MCGQNLKVVLSGLQPSWVLSQPIPEPEVVLAQVEWSFWFHWVENYFNLTFQSGPSQTYCGVGMWLFLSYFTVAYLSFEIVNAGNSFEVLASRQWASKLCNSGYGHASCRYFCWCVHSGILQTNSRAFISLIWCNFLVPHPSTFIWYKRIYHSCSKQP